MILKSLTALNFRSYEDISIELPSEGALFLGSNGVGKTNLLEAISFALLGKSPRGASPKDMISVGEREGFVKVTYGEGESLRSQAIGFSRDKQIKITQDGKLSSSLSSLYGENRFIYFGPEDINLITGSPEEKRRFIDLTLSQVDASYLSDLIVYRKTIRERNKLLTGRFDSVLCDIYDQQLSEIMARIVQSRTIFFQEISEEITSIYTDISDSESEVTVSYSPSVSFSTTEEYRFALSDRLLRDRENGYTSVGPHRDSFRSRKDGRQIVGYGSQGQCRSTALALKIASSSYLTRDNQELILTVDDAFSDLDRGRREKFFATIRDRGQLFIAIHSKEELQYYSLPQYQIFEGKVQSL